MAKATSFRNDASHDCRFWTMRKLVAEIEKYANLRSFGGGLPHDFKPSAQHEHACGDDGEAIREATRLYRETWLAPLIEELNRRLGFAKGN